VLNLLSLPLLYSTSLDLHTVPAYDCHPFPFFLRGAAKKSLRLHEEMQGASFSVS
jgi:hypothetical protein